MKHPGLVLGAALLFANGQLVGQAAPDTTTIRSILANGYRFAYVEAGQGTPAVFVHGALTDYRFWLGQIGALNGTARVIAYSRRHHYPNPSRRDDQPSGFASSAWDLMAVVRALQLERPVVVGHSWGGAVALQAVLREPALFRALILAEPVADSIILDPHLRADIARRAHEAFSLAMARHSERDPVEALRLWLDNMYGEGFWASVGAAGQGRLRDNAHTFASVGAPQPDLSCSQLAALSLPVLLIGGAESGARQRSTLDGLAHCLPGASRVTIPGAGALFPRTHPVEFADAVRRFLAALPR